jgi:hypothetical protein
LKCFNCYSEFLPTLSKPLCQECGFCYYCRDFFSCVHYDADNKEYNYDQEQQEQPLLQSPYKNEKKDDIQNWDSYHDLVSSTTLTTTTTPPDPENSTVVIVIVKSLRRKLGKFHILELIQKLTSPEMNCYVDIIPTGTSDNDVIKVFNYYVDIPALLLTSDKNLNKRLLGRSLFVKTKASNAITIVTEQVKHRISRL